MPPTLPPPAARIYPLNLPSQTVHADPLIPSRSPTRVQAGWTLLSAPTCPHQRPL